MRSTKRYLCLALVFVFAFALTLTGCGTPATPAATTASAASSVAPAASSVAPVSEVPKDAVELSWVLVGNKQETDTDAVMAKLDEYMKDKLNVTVKLQVFGWSDYDAKVNTMLSTGEPFDIVFTAGWAANYYTNAAAGYFTDLTPFLAKYPKITEVLGKDFANGSAISGKNYAVPTNKEKVHNWGYLLQKKLVDKYKIDVTSIKKMGDLDPWFAKIKTGEAGITPLLVVGGDSPFQFLDWDRVSDDTIPGALYADNRDNTIVNNFTAPESIAMYKTLRDYNQKGYIAKGAPTMVDTSVQMKTGKYFAVESSLKPGKDAEMSVSTGVDWVQVDLTQPVMSNRETAGALLAIPAASKNAERAFQFIEYLYTDTFVKNLVDYGIEGTHYTKGADGKITLTQAGTDKYNPGHGWMFGDQFKDLLMSNEDTQKWKKFLDYNGKGLVEKSLGFVFDKTPVDTETSACKTVVTTYNLQLFTGAADVDKTVTKLTNELKLSGVDALIKEQQSQYDKWRTANGK